MPILYTSPFFLMHRLRWNFRPRTIVDSSDQITCSYWVNIQSTYSLAHAKWACLWWRRFSPMNATEKIDFFTMPMKSRRWNIDPWNSNNISKTLVIVDLSSSRDIRSPCSVVFHLRIHVTMRPFESIIIIRSENVADRKMTSVHSLGNCLRIMAFIRNLRMHMILESDKTVFGMVLDPGGGILLGDMVLKLGGGTRCGDIFWLGNLTWRRLWGL